MWMLGCLVRRCSLARRSWRIWCWEECSRVHRARSKQPAPQALSLQLNHHKSSPIALSDTNYRNLALSPQASPPSIDGPSQQVETIQPSTRIYRRFTIPPKPTPSTWTAQFLLLLNLLNHLTPSDLEISAKVQDTILPPSPNAADAPTTIATAQTRFSKDLLDRRLYPTTYSVGCDTRETYISFLRL